MARAMVTQYGMSDTFGLVSLESVENRYLDGRPVLNCGEQTASQIDSEVMKIMKDSYDKAEAMLSENREVMDELAAFLTEKETITGKEFMEIFHRAKGITQEENEIVASEATASEATGNSEIS